jgi:hypothetical protein
MATEVNAHQASLRLHLNYVRLHFNFEGEKMKMQLEKRFKKPKI